MSLINEALKKAQRERAGESTDAPPVPGGGKIAKRGQPRSANSLLLLGGGAIALVFISVAVTVFFVNRSTPEPTPSPIAAASTPSGAAPDTAGANPMASTAPVVRPTASTTSEAKPTSAEVMTANTAEIRSTPAQPQPEVRAAADSAMPTAAEKSSTIAAPALIATPEAAEPAPTATTSVATSSIPAAPNVPPDERIYQYVDALRITGVKAAGNNSRVLMNDRVYRINDIVDRIHSLRLLKVEPNTLTFSDANGAIYVKNF